MVPVKIIEPTKHQIVAYAEVDYSRKRVITEHLIHKNFDLSNLETITNSNRQIEWLTIRYLLSQILTDVDIYYNESRKPFLGGNKAYLSISHSKSMVAISIDKKASTGVDIQFISEKINRIRNKFLNDKELLTFENNPTILTCCWSIKEALFKIYGNKDTFLKENFEVIDLAFDNLNGNAKGRTLINGEEEEFDLEIRRVGKYILVYNMNS